MGKAQDGGMRPELREEFSGQWTSIIADFGIEAHINGKHQPCCICGGTDRSRWDKNREMYFCSQCGHKGPIKLLLEFTGLAFKELADLIRKQRGNYSMTETKSNYDNTPLLKRVHSGLKKINQGDPVDLYLQNRGLFIRPKTLFYHPFMEYKIYYPCQGEETFPAMVAPIRNISGKLAAYHITYLTPDGKKIDRTPQKKFTPTIMPLCGTSIHLSDPGEEFGDLIISEGIESGLAAMQNLEIPAWAAGSADGMKKIEIPDFVKTVYIAADEDENFTGAAAAYHLANRLYIAGKKVIVMRFIHSEPFLDRGCKYDYCEYIEGKIEI